MTEIEPSTPRILNAKGRTIGCGFLVSRHAFLKVFFIHEVHEEHEV